MTNFVLVVFRDEKQGLRGVSALERLDREGSVDVHGAALLERDEDGLLLLRKDLSGKLLERELGATVARAPRDLLAFVTRDLARKTFALIAELGNDATATFGARMAPLGGSVVHQWRASAS